MSYATTTDMTQRYDARLIGELVADDGVKVAAGSLGSNGVLLAVLADASAAIDAAVSVGNRYTRAQMADLSTTAAAFITRLTCDISLLYLKRRRGVFNAEKDAALLEEVNRSLKSLRDGNDVLLLDGATEAPAATIELVKPELVPLTRPNTIRRRTRNYYPN